MTLTPHDSSFDEDADAEARNRIAEKIRAAFADVAYPGDDKIAVVSENDSKLAYDSFVGKDWRQLDISFFGQSRSSGIHYLTDEAFVYYLPAYLLAALVPSDPRSPIDVLLSYFSRLDDRPLSEGSIKCRRLLNTHQYDAVREVFRYLATWMSGVTFVEQHE